MQEHETDHDPTSATTLDRRQFVQLSGGVSAAIGLALLPGEMAQAAPRGGYPFTLGVASGDPAPDGFVLWTRLAPQPAEVPHRNASQVGLCGLAGRHRRGE